MQAHQVGREERAAPPPGALRPLRESDADAVVALYGAAYGDRRPIDAQEVVSWFRNPELAPERLRVLELDGRIVGYGDLWVEPDVVALEVAAPGHWDTFLRWAEDTARAEGVPRARAYFPAGHELESVVAARGYRYWRSAYTMQIDLEERPPAAAPLPDGIRLRTYRSADAEPLRVALNAAFAHDPFFRELTPSQFDAFYLGARGFDPALWLLAWADEELAGFVLAVPERAGEPGLGWIESLGVVPRRRRRGLGSALLRAAFVELHSRGLRRVGLGVDGGNETGAVRLYERAGMRAVRRGDNWVLDV